MFGRSWTVVAVVTTLLVGCGEDSGDVGGTTSSAGGGGSAGGGPIDVDAGLLDYPCAPGELELDDGCQPAGIPAASCPDGFAADERGGCLPILPTEPCAPGTMAIPGETTCREVAPCGTGAWDGIPVEPGTIYVDKSYVGASDGSSSAPFKGLPAAIGAAEPGAIVALAPGSYNYLTLETKPVRLWGKCPAEVSFTQGIYVKGQASGTEIHRVGVTSGGNIGILVENTDVTVDECWVHDVPHIGVYVYTLNDSATASLTVSRSLVEEVTTHGAYNQGNALTVDQSVIRDVHPQGDAKGTGIQHYWEAGQSAAPGTVAVTASLIERTRRAGIRMWLGTATVAGTAIRDIAANAGEEEGTGITGRADEGLMPAITLDGVTTERTVMSGIFVLDGDVTARRVTVRDVTASPLSAASIGLGCLSTGTLERPELTMREASLAAIDQWGVDVMGTDGLLEGVRVEEVVGGTTMPGAGAGLLVEQAVSGDPSVVTLRGIAVEDVETLGVYLSSSQATLSEIAVRQVAPHNDSGAFGRGISFEYAAAHSTGGSTGELSNCLVADVHDYGISVLGSSATVTSCHVDGVALPPTGSGGGEPPSIGIYVQQGLDNPLPATATISHVVIDEVVSVGIGIAAANGTIDAAIVRDVGAPGELLGDGICAMHLYYASPESVLVVPTTLAVTGSQVFGSQRAGLSTFASALSLTGNVVSCNTIDLNGEPSFGTDFEITDGGDNWCGCGDDWSQCKVLSSNLEPPPAAMPGK